MNIITLDQETFAPDILHDINLKTSIVICALETNINFLLYNNDRLYLMNNRNDIIFNNLKTIGNTISIFDYNPHIKWSVPKGVNLNFVEPRKMKAVFNKIHTNYLEVDSDPLTHDLLNISFCVYVDKERAKETPVIHTADRLFEINIDYNSFVEDAVEEVYILQNNYVFQEFKKHLDK